MIVICDTFNVTFALIFRKVEFKDSDEEEEEVDEEDDDDDGDDTKVSRSSRRHKKVAASKAKKHSKSLKRKNVTTTSDDEDDDGVKGREKTSSSSKSKPVLKRDELTTVKMEELTDLFSKPKVYFAKKSHPDETSRLVEVESPPKPQRQRMENQVVIHASFF